ncbi:MAG TPA: MarR family transcriptional regulator [Steroidobacteraceae bacterium]|nr:MarR family transcriptional regulator [Steroidobacteraceae bacterium]
MTAAAQPLTLAPDDPNLQAGRLIKLVYFSLLRNVDARMQPLELTAMQWEPLLMLALGRADTVAALARECNVDCGAMTRMLDRLEQKQLLQRQRSEHDRRVVNLALTAKGREAAAEIPRVVREELRRHLAGFSAAELQTLTGLLTRMLGNTNAPPSAREAAQP